MGFDDLNHKLEKYFLKEIKSVDIKTKTAIKEDVLNFFEKEKQSIFSRIFSFIFSSKYSGLSSTALVGILLLGVIPLYNNQLYAGEISSDQGLVEIIRDGERIILKGKSKLKIGDEILVKNNATADLKLRNEFHSEVFENSTIKVSGKDELFLVEGQLNNNFRNGKISTNKGEILAQNKDSIVSVYVTNSGETHIAPKRNSIMVRNWSGEEIQLTTGEELRLRTDTNLSMKKNNDGINLSDTQIQAIRAKLFIARTKALNYIENSIDKDYGKAKVDLYSAKKTFKSIAQVLKTSRNMEMLSPRENIDMLENKDIYTRLKEKTNNEDLLLEVKSVEILLEIIEKQKVFDFPVPQTDILSFNRYVILSRLFANKSEKEIKYGEILRDQYVLSFARTIFNEELRIDQISVLNSEIKKMPKTSTIAKFFLLQVKEMFTPDLQELLKEKIEKDFN